MLIEQFAQPLVGDVLIVFGIFQSLIEAPNNGWALYGLSQAYADQGARRAAKHAKSLLRDAWAGDAKALALPRL